jgi:signal transduction histidine kinase
VPRLTFRLFQRRYAAWWTVVAGLMVTAGLTWTLQYEAWELDQQRMIRRALEIRNQLDARLEKSEMLLNNLRDYLRLSGESQDSTLNRWCYDNGLTINCPWLHGIVVVTNRHSPQWRDQFPNPPNRWTVDDWDRLREIVFRQPVECEIALKTSVTNAMRYVADYRLRSFGHAKDRFAGAVKNSRVQMSERRSVMVDAKTNSLVGTLFYVPIYRPEVVSLIADIDSVRSSKYYERGLLYWLHLESMIVAPLSFDVLADAIREGAPLDVEIELFSSIDQTAQTWLANSGGTPRAVDPAFKPYLTLRLPWRMYGENFSIFFYTTPLFEAQSPRRLAKTAGLAGFAITLLATALVGVSVRARNRQDGLTGQIREARDALAAAQRERERISRDLHDGTIQSLYAIQLGLGHTAVRMKSEPADAGSELFAVRRELNTVIAEIRQFIMTETAQEAHKAVDFGNVLKALTQRARGGTTARIGLRCDAEASARLTSDQAVQLANIAREALSNALRHGRPQQVNLELRQEGEFVVLEVVDDGAGFNPDARERSGLGLLSITARAEESGGTLAVDSSPGQGTRVVVRMPVETAELVEPEKTEAPEREP